MKGSCRINFILKRKPIRNQKEGERVGFGATWKSASAPTDYDAVERCVQYSIPISISAQQQQHCWWRWTSSNWRGVQPCGRRPGGRINQIYFAIHFRAEFYPRLASWPRSVLGLVAFVAYNHLLKMLLLLLLQRKMAFASVSLTQRSLSRARSSATLFYEDCVLPVRSGNVYRGRRCRWSLKSLLFKRTPSKLEKTGPGSHVLFGSFSSCLAVFFRDPLRTRPCFLFQSNSAKIRFSFGRYRNAIHTNLSPWIEAPSFWSLLGSAHGFVESIVDNIASCTCH